jgi:hypothetical protein
MSFLAPRLLFAGDLSPYDNTKNSIQGMVYKLLYISACFSGVASKSFPASLLLLPGSWSQWTLNKALKLLSRSVWLFQLECFWGLFNLILQLVFSAVLDLRVPGFSVAAWQLRKVSRDLIWWNLELVFWIICKRVCLFWSDSPSFCSFLSFSC